VGRAETGVHPTQGGREHLRPGECEQAAGGAEMWSKRPEATRLPQFDVIIGSAATTCALEPAAPPL